MRETHASADPRHAAPPAPDGLGRRGARAARAALARVGVRVTATEALAFRLQAAVIEKQVPLPAAPLTDGVVVLRRLQPTDGPALREFIRGEPGAWLREQATLYEAGLAVDLCVVGHGGGEPRGIVQLHRFDWPNRRASVGLWLRPDARGLGLMRRSLPLVTGWVLGAGVLDRLEYLARADNERSLRLAERCGYREEGRLRSCLIQDRRRHDAVLLAAVAGEWKAPEDVAQAKAAPEEGDRGA